MEDKNASKGKEPEIEHSPSPNDAAGTSYESLLDVKIRFGPWSKITDSDIIPELKNKAWDHLVSISQRVDNQMPSIESNDIPQNYSDVILQRYSDAINPIINDLRERYPFHHCEMLIKDGCFFLQLALSILGCHEKLGYSSDHFFFGVEFKENNKTFIENMFTVDNQIPIVFLKKLMAQKFFIDIMDEQKWNPTPSSLAEKALYELLVLPVLKKVQNNQPDLDILQGLRIMLIGGQNLPFDEDFDVEANLEGGNVNAHETAASIDASATNLNRSWIYIKKVESGGIRGIDFCNYWILTRVYLPTFSLDETTEKILQNLMLYEKQNFRNHQQREVSSYIKLMNGIVRRERDAKFLADSKIILCDTGGVKKLPGILRKLVKLASESPPQGQIVLTPQLQTVRDRIRDHSPVLTQFKGLFTLMGILTMLQVVIGIVQVLLR